MLAVAKLRQNRVETIKWQGTSFFAFLVDFRSVKTSALHKDALQNDYGFAEADSSYFFLPFFDCCSAIAQ